MYMYRNDVFFWSQDINSPTCNATTCSFTPSPSLNLTNASYMWNVMAYTSDWGDYDEAKYFTKVNPPSPQFPSNSTTTINPKFIWSKVADQTRYQVILYDSTNTVVLDKTLYTPVCTTTICSFTPNPSVNLVLNGTYKWKVRAFNGMWGSYSALKILRSLHLQLPFPPREPSP